MRHSSGSEFVGDAGTGAERLTVRPVLGVEVEHQFEALFEGEAQPQPGFKDTFNRTCTPKL